MSAWIVSSHHVDLLVSAAIEHGVYVRFLNAGPLERATEENAQAIGLMLWTENIRSVVYRYNLTGSEEEQGHLSSLNAYSFRRYAGIRASAVAKAVACFDYQACECPDYRETPAAFFVQQLQQEVGEQPAGYDKEPWGFDSAAQVEATQATTPTTTPAINAPAQFDYSPWRHGGWYVHNVRYPSGAAGCVSRNYEDKKWRIVCDPRPFEDQPTFRTRDEAARAEWLLVQGQQDCKAAAPIAPDETTAAP